MPSKYAMMSNVRYDENMRYDVTYMCVIASEGLPAMIALLVQVVSLYNSYFIKVIRH